MYTQLVTLISEGPHQSELFYSAFSEAHFVNLPRPYTKKKLKFPFLLVVQASGVHCSVLFDRTPTPPVFASWKTELNSNWEFK